MLVLKGFNDENLIKILGVLCNKSMCYESERKWKKVKDFWEDLFD